MVWEKVREQNAKKMYSPMYLIENLLIDKLQKLKQSV